MRYFRATYLKVDGKHVNFPSQNGGRYKRTPYLAARKAITKASVYYGLEKTYEIEIQEVTRNSEKKFYWYRYFVRSPPVDSSTCFMLNNESIEICPIELIAY